VAQLARLVECLRNQRPGCFLIIFDYKRTQLFTHLKGETKMAANLEKLVDDLSALTVIEAAELAKLLEARSGAFPLLLLLRLLARLRLLLKRKTASMLSSLTAVQTKST
jgi:hypothetical protein